MTEWVYKRKIRIRQHLDTLARRCLRSSRSDPGCKEEVELIGSTSWERNVKYTKDRSNVNLHSRALSGQQDFPPPQKSHIASQTGSGLSGLPFPKSSRPVSKDPVPDAPETWKLSGSGHVSITRAALACLHKALFARLSVPPARILARQRYTLFVKPCLI